MSALFSGASLTGSYSVGGSAQTYGNTIDYRDQRQRRGGRISGRSRNAPGNATVTVAIAHIYIDDLKVDMGVPDGRSPPSTTGPAAAATTSTGR